MDHPTLFLLPSPKGLFFGKDNTYGEFILILHTASVSLCFLRFFVGIILISFSFLPAIAYSEEGYYYCCLPRLKDFRPSPQFDA